MTPLVQLKRLRRGVPEVVRIMSFAAIDRFARRRSAYLTRADQTGETSYRIKASGFRKCAMREFGIVRPGASPR